MVVTGKKWAIVVILVVGNYKTYLSNLDFAYLTPLLSRKKCYSVRKRVRKKIGSKPQGIVI